MTKELIRIFVLIGPETNGVQTHFKIVNNEKRYYGFAWDIMQGIKKLKVMNEKYKFEFIFSEFGFSNYDSVVKEVAEGKYDICLGLFIHNAKREKLINYTKDIIIIPNAIFHKKKKTLLDIIKNIYLKIYHLLAIFTVFCIFFTFIFNIVLKQKKFKQNLLFAVATFFGEYGPITEKYRFNFKYIIISTIIFLMTFIILAYFEGQILKLILKEKDTYDINDFKEKPLLAHMGYATAKKLENQGANVVFLENKKNSDLIDIYLKNQDKYSGVTVTYCDGFPFLDGSGYKDSVNGLKASINYGVDPCGFIVNPNKNDILEDMNSSITILRESKELNRICASYYGKIKGYNVCNFY